MDKKEMMQIVFEQPAIDYNCSPNDFLKNKIIFTEAEALEGIYLYSFYTAA